MEIVFFSGVTLSLVLFLWQFTYCLGGYNQTFEGITVTLLQNAVTYEYSEQNKILIISSDQPYFHETLTKSLVEQYVDETLPGATFGGDYELDFAFSQYRYYASRKPRYPMKVTITLAYESPAYSATRSKSFQITKKGAAYES